MEKYSLRQRSRFSFADRCLSSDSESKDASKSMVLVLLTDLCERRKQELASTVQDLLPDEVLIETWQPTRMLLESINKQGRCRDSQSNIYALAILAYRSGISRFLVADELTKRQFSRDTLPDEEEEISGVIVSVYPKSATANEVCVCASRSSWKDGERSLLEELESLKDHASAVANRKKWGMKRTFWNEKVVLHDPDRGLFAADTPGLLGWEARWGAIIEVLSAKGLPTELVDDALAREHEAPRTKSILERKRVPSIKPMWKEEAYRAVVIFLLFSTTDEEFHNMGIAIQHAVDDYTASTAEEHGFPEEKLNVDLIRWELHGARTRRELMEFWEDFCLWEKRSCPDRGDAPFNFLLEPFSNIDLAQFGTILCDAAVPAATFLSPLSETVRRVQGAKCATWAELRELNAEISEDLCHPDQPFYLDLPWVPPRLLGRGEDIAIDIHFLTNQLREKVNLKIRAEVLAQGHTDSDVYWEAEHKSTTFIPWKEGEPDGTVEDIWKILLERGHDTIFACIDQTSKKDQKVILVDPKEFQGDVDHKLLKDLQCPHLMGFHYTRVKARELHVIKGSLEIGWPTMDELCAIHGWRGSFEGRIGRCEEHILQKTRKDSNGIQSPGFNMTLTLARTMLL